jgi:hypothetical protein
VHVRLVRQLSCSTLAILGQRLSPSSSTDSRFSRLIAGPLFSIQACLTLPGLKYDFGESVRDVNSGDSHTSTCTSGLRIPESSVPTRTYRYGLDERRLPGPCPRYPTGASTSLSQQRRKERQTEKSHGLQRGFEARCREDLSARA